MWVDLAWRTAYRLAYAAARVYFAVCRPSTHGALVALWREDRILLVRTSYQGYWSLPGGYVKRGEQGIDAALRELEEEVGVAGVSADRLERVYDETRNWRGKKDHVEIFALEVTEAPTLTVDNREVVEARFFSAEEALGLKLFPPIANVIRARLAR
jgi:ADP-ribose pyrophosphatase YjhB (NUDIX family)